MSSIDSIFHANIQEEIVVLLPIERMKMLCHELNMDKLETMMTCYQLGYTSVTCIYTRGQETPEDGEDSIAIIVPNKEKDRALAFAMMLAKKCGLDYIMSISEGNTYFIHVVPLDGNKPLPSQLESKDYMESVGGFNPEYLAVYPYGKRGMSSEIIVKSIESSGRDDSYKRFTGMAWENLVYNKSLILRNLREDLFYRDLFR